MSKINDKQRVSLKGVEVFPFAEADELIDYVDDRKGILVAVNAEKIVNASRDEATRAIINSNIAYFDGAWAVKAARQKGAEPRKIAGCELWLKIIERFHSSRSFYIIGASPEVNAATVAKLHSEFPDINIVGARDGYLRTPPSVPLSSTTWPPSAPTWFLWQWVRPPRRFSWPRCLSATRPFTKASEAVSTFTPARWSVLRAGGLTIISKPHIGSCVSPSVLPVITST